MKQQTVLPRWLLLAALIALGGFSLVQASPPKNEAKEKSSAEKKTAKAVLRPSLTAKLSAADLAHEIDQAVGQRLAAEKVKASPLADDAEFVRRVTLDLAGHIPSAEKTVEFLDSKDRSKRAKLIDELLASDEYGMHMADVWKDLLVKRNSDNRRFSFDPLVEWLTKNFNENKPWDQMVRELLTAEGTQEENGAVTYFLANNTVDKMTDSTTKVFLGVQLQCAQCHNHPFTDWKQTEYWGMAAFFMNVKLTGPRNPAKQEGSPGIVESKTFRGRKQQLPDSAKVVPAKFLGGPEMKLDGKEKVRPMLAKWMTSADNPYFSKAMVNRAWFQMFGRGLVNPVDNMDGVNEPSHPQLLVDLADQFASSGFDLKQLYRTLCNSKTYQRTSKPVAGNEDADPSLFARAAVRVMTPEQEFDSLLQVAAPHQNPRTFKPVGLNKAKMKGGKNQNFSPRSQFVAFFEAEDATDPTEYQDGIPQALRLMNGPGLNNSVILNGLLRTGQSPEQIIDRLYLATLSRRPTAGERDRMIAYVAKHKSEPREGYADVLWVLMNGSEFVMNH